MFEREIRVRTRAGVMTTFVVHPAGDGSFPVALLYMDGVGYREQLKENGRKFAGEGYYCVIPDLFYRSGELLTFDVTRLAAAGFIGPEADRLTHAVAAASPENVVADTKAILATIASDSAASPGAKVCVGYCMGARLGLHMLFALPDQLVAAAAIHPGALITEDADSPHHDLDGIRGELYVAFAETDRSVTAEHVEQFREAMRRNSVRGVVERLPGTNHGFAMADLPAYNHDATERHFARTLELWGRSLAQAQVGA